MSCTRSDGVDPRGSVVPEEVVVVLDLEAVSVSLFLTRESGEHRGQVEDAELLPDGREKGVVHLVVVALFPGLGQLLVEDGLDDRLRSGRRELRGRAPLHAGPVSVPRRG